MTLDKLRTQIGALQVERAELNQPHRGRDEARADVAAYCRMNAASVEPRLAHAVGSGDLAGLALLRARPDGLIDAGPLLAALLGPEALAAALMRYADALPPSVDAAAPAARLAQVLTELDRLEQAEEVEVCRFEAQGLKPARRAGARPEIVLQMREV